MNAKFDLAELQCKSAVNVFWFAGRKHPWCLKERKSWLILYVNDRLVSSTGIGIIKDSTGSMLCGNKDKAVAFNKFFAAASFTSDD